MKITKILLAICKWIQGDLQGNQMEQFFKEVAETSERYARIGLTIMY